MDHSRVQINVARSSCGILELSNPSQEDTEGVLYQIASYLYHPSRGTPAAFLLFSTVADGYNPLMIMYGRGMLSGINTSPRAENPKTGNVIQVFVGVIDHVVFKKWYIDERISRLKNI